MANDTLTAYPILRVNMVVLLRKRTILHTVHNVQALYTGFKIATVRMCSLIVKLILLTPGILYTKFKSKMSLYFKFINLLIINNHKEIAQTPLENIGISGMNCQ